MKTVILTGDPIKDFEKHDAEQQERLKKFPVCKLCDHPIQQEDAVCFNGRWYCDECLSEHRESVGDY